jgi:hypothetical protein
MLLGKDLRLGNYVIDRDGNSLRIDSIEYIQDGYDTKITEIINVPDDNEDHKMTEWTSFC